MRRAVPQPRQLGSAPQRWTARLAAAAGIRACSTTPAAISPAAAAGQLRLLSVRCTTTTTVHSAAACVRRELVKLLLLLVWQAAFVTDASLVQSLSPLTVSTVVQWPLRPAPPSLTTIMCSSVKFSA